MSLSHSTSDKSSPSLSVVTSSNMHQHSSASDSNFKHADSSSQTRKLPLGAMVSPLSPFFNERAKFCALEQAKTKAVEVALADLDIGNTNSRARSTSQSSKLSEACSSASYSSVSSQDSHHSNIATPISTMGDETLPPSLPRISYEDWSKFGINLFAPKLLNPHSKIYYHYPNVEKKKTHVNHLNGNRSRLRSSTVHGYSHPQDKGNHNFNTPVNPQSPNLPAQNRPHPQSPLTRFCSLRHPLERNYTR
ncbi:hypothetical protein PCASD_17906 [Puccinia coronata f. sp. avenae]|uniref:Uncharacterized protein n=1 Tax=Puccinia coronata f. sp. avenae TaxID=200324 RepID=A0A2N5U950_9BASI|nr:hypothetical protein PCASD_17906 [Puccinia coronata f. sp. avenae]